MRFVESLLRLFFFSILTTNQIPPLIFSTNADISGGFSFQKNLFSFLFFTDVGVRNINVRVKEILLISYSNSILLTEGDRGLRKSF